MCLRGCPAWGCSRWENWEKHPHQSTGALLVELRYNRMAGGGGGEDGEASVVYLSTRGDVLTVQTCRETLQESKPGTVLRVAVYDHPHACLGTDDWQARFFKANSGRVAF